jgi:hypothetical protein
MRNTENYCYSLNDESYEDCFEDVCEKAFDYEGVKVGDTIKISRGIPVKTSISDHFDLSLMLDNMGEDAYESAGEYAEYWPECTAQQYEQLERDICDVLTRWADKYNKHPTFYRVEDTKDIVVELAAEGEYKVLFVEL